MKYKAQPTLDGQANLYKDGKVIAKFWNDAPNNYTNARKIADLLNETSRSQGKYP